jgi:GNAT superfamily N-acetyltransferase
MENKDPSLSKTFFQSKGVEDFDALLATNNEEEEKREPHDRDDDDLVVTNIGALVVEPTYRGLGLGKTLAKVAVAWCVYEIGAHPSTGHDGRTGPVVRKNGSHFGPRQEQGGCH